MRVRGLLEWAVGHFKPVMIGIWAATGLCLVVSAVFIISNNSSPRQTVLDINVAPTIADIKIDGMAARNGSHVVEPGKHLIEISAEGFESKSLEVDVVRDETNSVAEYLENNEEGISYYTRSKADMDVLRSIAKTNDDVKDFIAEYDHKISIFPNLPMKEDYYISGVGYTTMEIKDARNDRRCGSTLCIKVVGFKSDESSFNRQAVKMLSSRGYKLTDYEVYYEYR